MLLPDTQPIPIGTGAPNGRASTPDDAAGQPPAGAEPPEQPPQGPTGAEPPEQPPQPPTRPEPCILDSRWAQDSQVTRLLCATAHLHGEYTEEASGTLFDPSFSALAPSWGLDPVALAQHARLARGRRLDRDRSLRYCLAGMVLIPLVVLALAQVRSLPPFSVALSIVLVTAVGFVVAWMIVFAHYELIRVSALETMNGRLAPRDTAPALDTASRERLEQLAEANTVVFGGYQPFVGCGITLDSWTICIDVLPDMGEGLTPFDALELHEHLLRTIPLKTPTGLWAVPRLFVAGSAATSVPGLIPDPRDADTWPASRLPDDVLDRYTRQPSEAARTYVCFAHPAWKGEIVVSMLARAELAGSKLFVEGRTHALLPPKASFREVKYVPKHPRRAWLAVARSAAAVVVPLLFGSYGRKLDLMKSTHDFRRNRERQRKDLIAGNPFNYGATSSLREDVADPAELKYYAAVDEVRSFRVLKRQILTAIEAFLADHGVMVTDFRLQADESLGETTVHLHDLAAAEGSFGPRNTVTVHP
jgi:hypothetical protein